MINRKIEKRLNNFFDKKENKALLITGARQVGKTYIIREFSKKYEHFVEINFIEKSELTTLFSNCKGRDDFLLRLSAVAGNELVKGKTLVFFDEVQECKDIVTAIKFLVEEGSYQYVLSGSLLGIELKDIRSVPVGYMDIIEMYPLDFEEFLYANFVSSKIVDSLKDSFYNEKVVDDVIHEKIMDLFLLYLIVGGMPEAVQKFIETNNISEVVKIQNTIINAYKKDIAKYDADSKLYLEDIFNLIPSELNNKNKRFILKDLNENKRFSRFRNSFIWLKEAGVALPAFCVDEPKVPLLLSKSTNLFKLFLSDVGLLSSMYMNDIQIKILSKEKDINFGSIYENFAAQELKAHGFDLFYFNSKKQGELDFVIEQDAEVLPIEMKSGKCYSRHVALDNVMSSESYDIQKAYVFYNGNVNVNDKVKYLPVYMLMFIEKKKLDDDFIYIPDIECLK